MPASCRQEAPANGTGPLPGTQCVPGLFCDFWWGVVTERPDALQDGAKAMHNVPEAAASTHGDPVHEGDPKDDPLESIGFTGGAEGARQKVSPGRPMTQQAIRRSLRARQAYWGRA